MPVCDKHTHAFLLFITIDNIVVVTIIMVVIIMTIVFMIVIMIMIIITLLLLLLLILLLLYIYIYSCVFCVLSCKLTGMPHLLLVADLQARRTNGSRPHSRIGWLLYRFPGEQFTSQSLPFNENNQKGHDTIKPGHVSVEATRSWCRTTNRKLGTHTHTCP